MKMFPDSGVPPQDAINSLPDVDSDCPAELWYSTSRCQPRFDPAAANAMLAELMNLVMKGQVQYSCSVLDNIEHAVRYIVQRGLPNGALLESGPTTYTTSLDPHLTHYNDYLALTAVPIVNNTGPTTVNVDSRGNVPVLRPDGTALQPNDLKAGVPAILVYYSGVFYLVAPVPGPEAPPDFVDVWIRTDGNDATGDGSANTADKAFRTVGGAWTRVIDRFKQFPATTLDMKLGIPGTYEGGAIGPFGGNVILTGDQANPAAYRITTVPGNISLQAVLGVVGMSQLMLRGVTIDMNIPSSMSAMGLRVINSTVYSQVLRLEASVDHTGAPLMSVEQNGVFGLSLYDVIFEGNGHQISSAIKVESGSTVLGATGSFQFRNMQTSQGTIVATILSSFQAKNAAIIGSAVVGPQYQVTANAVIAMSGQPCPGSTPGAASTGGQFIP